MLDSGSALFGLAACITALGTFWSSVRNGHKVDKVQETTDVVHKLVNSNLDAVKSSLAAAEQEIRELRALVSRLNDHIEAQRAQASTFIS